jgi:serine phosphatase RsbU (regulator of sigma subunit)
MNLRLRLIVAFFLLSVVPLGAVTLYTYASHASAIREAAGREAQTLAGDLSERMTLVTAQLSQRFEQLMEIPAPATPQPSPAPAAGADTARGSTPAFPDATAIAAAVATAQAGAMEAVQASVGEAAQTSAREAARVASELGEVAILLDTIEIRGFGRGRGPATVRGFPNAVPFAPPPVPPGPPVPGPPPAADGAREGPAFGQFPPPRLGRDGVAGGRATGRSNESGSQDGRGSAPNRLQIDLGPMRREILKQVFPDRDNWDQLSSREREMILTRVNERMLGIRQSIESLEQRAGAAANAQAAAAALADGPNASPAAPGSTVAEPADVSGNRRPAPRTAPSPPRARPLPSTTTTGAARRSSAGAAPLERSTAMTGRRMDVRVVRNGEVVGQVNAEINLPNLLATVFTTTRRDRGEVPFAVDSAGTLYTPTEADRSVITALESSATRPDTPPGTELLPKWVVVTSADPTGSGLKFGIARPLGEALDDLRRSSTLNAGLGLAFIGLALAGIVPLSSHLTRNLSRLSDGVKRIATGDYGVRLDVSSKDEIGRLASAFNRMAADVERHQRAAVEQERLRRELELGRQIQHDMLPRAPLRLGLTEIRGVSVPATEVGGDFFNYFQTSSGRIALVVGDVSGKGVGAALLMANIQASLRTRLALGQDLASLARELDADIDASTPGSIYATLFVGLLDPESRTLDYVNAGHHPQFVLRSTGGLERMESTGLPIGLLAGHGYGERRVTLAPGDVLFFYTDGCVEAENGSGEMFSSERLESLLTARPAGPGEDLLVRIEREIVQFRSGREPFDDATMMVVNIG